MRLRQYTCSIPGFDMRVSRTYKPTAPVVPVKRTVAPAVETDKVGVFFREGIPSIFRLKSSSTVARRSVELPSSYLELCDLFVLSCASLAASFVSFCSSLMTGLSAVVMASSNASKRPLMDGLLYTVLLEMIAFGKIFLSAFCNQSAPRESIPS